MEETQKQETQKRLFQVGPRLSWTVLVSVSAAVALIAFLIGYVPMASKLRQRAAKVEILEQQQALLELQTTLGSSAIDARQGRYEPARQQTSHFYTALADELNKGDASAFANIQREGVSALLTQRDELITLLARNDPASADRLANLYVQYRKAVAPAAKTPAGVTN